MKDRELLKPMVKLVGNMHGNKAVNHQIHTIYTLSTNYLHTIYTT